jgi:hypothetical protein
VHVLPCAPTPTAVCRVTHAKASRASLGLGWSFALAQRLAGQAGACAPSAVSSEGEKRQKLLITFFEKMLDPTTSLNKCWYNFFQKSCFSFYEKSRFIIFLNLL